MIENQNIIPVYVVIVAGGQGMRMGSALPKQFLPIGGKPILYHTISAFAKALPQSQIILVLPEHEISKLQMVLQHFPERIDMTVVSGGPTRFDSVKNGLKDIPKNSIVLVHDGVRPFISDSLIRRSIKGAEEYGAVIPAIHVTDSIRMFVEEGESVPVDRNKLRAIQTPQAFQSNILLPAFAQEYKLEFTDEATVVESLGIKVRMIEGDRNNIKITTPEDLIQAENILIQKI